MPVLQRYTYTQDPTETFLPRNSSETSVNFELQARFAHHHWEKRQNITLSGVGSRNTTVPVLDSGESIV